MTEAPMILPRVNGVPLVNADEAVALDEPTLRQRACTELLRQAAQAAGLLAADDPVPEQGAISPAAADAIEALLDQALVCPEPTEEACRRHFAAHAGATRWARRCRPAMCCLPSRRAWT